MTTAAPANTPGPNATPHGSWPASRNWPPSSTRTGPPTARSSGRANDVSAHFRAITHACMPLMQASVSPNVTHADIDEFSDTNVRGPSDEPDTCARCSMTQPSPTTLFVTYAYAPTVTSSPRTLASTVAVGCTHVPRPR